MPISTRVPSPSPSPTSAFTTSSSNPRRRVLATAGAATAVALGMVVTSTTSASAWGAPDSTAPESEAVSTQPYAVDTFDRETTSGWGEASSGAWEHSAAASAFRAEGGVATTALGSTGGNQSSFLDVSSTDTELQAQVGLAALPKSGTVDLYATARALDTTSGYRFKLKVQTDGTVVPSLLRVNGTSASTIATTTERLRLDPTADLQVRVQATGTSPTVVSAKAWPTGTQEPDAWTLTASDSTAALQTAGGVAFTTYAPATAGAVTSQVADVWAGPTDAARDLSADKTLAPEPGTYVPSASTTGVPRGTYLQVHNGDLTITKAGTVVNGMDIRGFVTVKAKDVVIQNTIVRGRATDVARGLVVVESTGSLKISDSELYNSTPNWLVDGLRGSGTIDATRLNIHDVIDNVHFYGDNKKLTASWLHDTLHYENDPSHSDGTHDDNVQIVKGANISLIGNRMEGAYNAAIMVTQGLGTVTGLVIERNFLDHGACTVNVAESGRGAIALQMSGNTFGSHSRKGCAYIAPTTTTSKSTITSNTYEDGSAITLKKG